MVGDSVTIRPAGSGWRPPDWITNPEVALDLPAEEVARAPSRPSAGAGTPSERAKTSTESVQRYGGGAPEGTARFRRGGFRGAIGRGGFEAVEKWRREGRGAEDYDVEAAGPRAVYVADRARQSLPRRRAVMEQHQQHLRRANWIGRHRLTFWQQVCAILLSIFVGLSLLGMIATLLSTKLDDLETKLETRTANRLYPDNSDSVAGSRISTPSVATIGANGRHHRRMLNNVDNFATTHAEEEHSKETGSKNAKSVPSFSVVSSVRAILHAASSFVRVRNMVADDTERPSTMASLFVGGIDNAMHHLAARRQLSSFLPPNQQSLGPPASQEQVQAVAATLQLELQKLINGILDSQQTGAIPQSVQVPQALESAQNPLLGPESVSVTPALMPNSLPVAADFGSRSATPNDGATSDSGKFFNSVLPKNPSSRSEQEPSSNLQNMPGVSLPVAPSVATVLPETVPTRNIPHANNLQSQHELSSFVPPEAVEMWTLPNGKYVCRAYRACRMEDRTILLPQWMRRHADALKGSCNLENVRFVLENTQPGVNDGSQFAIRHQGKEFPNGINISLEHGGRDVFGHTAPRDHMPHFVSDTFKPLASMEALFGSGKAQKTKVSALINPQTGGAAPAKDVPAFTHFLPSLQLYEGTLTRPPSDWVPSMAQMYKNIGFEFVSAGMEKPDAKESSKASMTGACFRSMITNNLKRYEPHGMFDASGHNVLYTFNKLSRDDPAVQPAMKAKPCTVHVTALTRQGPRALLKLPELEMTLTKMSQELGITTVFRTVDFNEGFPFAKQVETMQTSNVLIATHGAGNANFMFMRPRTGVIEIFPFSYRAGPFNEFARICGLDYRHAMSEPQTDVFKECMNRHEKKESIKKYAFGMWDKAVIMNKKEPGVHRLQFETEFGLPGQSEGMTTRQCVRMQELEFNIPHVASMAIEMAREQCHRAQTLQ